MKGGAAGGCRVGRAAGGDRDRDRDSPGGELGAREATSSVEIVSAVGYGSGGGGGGVPVRTPPPPPRAEAALWGRGNSLSVSVTAVRPQWGSLLSGELGFLSSPAAPEG